MTETIVETRKQGKSLLRMLDLIFVPTANWRHQYKTYKEDWAEFMKRDNIGIDGLAFAVEQFKGWALATAAEGARGMIYTAGAIKLLEYLQ